MKQKNKNRKAVHTLGWMVKTMLILNNKSIMGTDTVAYDIHKDVESDVPVGIIVYTIGEKGTIVALRLYDDELIDGSNWPKGPHHYSDEIMACLRFAEPNLGKVVAMDMEKVIR